MNTKIIIKISRAAIRTQNAKVSYFEGSGMVIFNADMGSYQYALLHMYSGIFAIFYTPTLLIFQWKSFLFCFLFL